MVGRVGLERILDGRKGISNVVCVRDSEEC